MALSYLILRIQTLSFIALPLHLMHEHGQKISAIIIFIGCWIYCIASYGFLLGVGLGWLPAIITASILSLFSHYIVFGAIGLGFFILLN